MSSGHRWYYNTLHLVSITQPAARLLPSSSTRSLPSFPSVAFCFFFNTHTAYAARSRVHGERREGLEQPQPAPSEASIPSCTGATGDAVPLSIHSTRIARGRSPVFPLLFFSEPVPVILDRVQAPSLVFFNWLPVFLVSIAYFFAGIVLTRLADCWAIATCQEGAAADF